MPKLSQQCLDDLNQAIPFTDLLKVSTKYRGECSCPFCGSDHHVKVYLNQNAAHCAKCGADFNMIQAWMKIHEMNDPDDLPQAAKEISEHYKVPLEYENGGTEYPPEWKESSAQKTTSQNAHTATETQSADKNTVDDEKALKSQNTASEDIPPEMVERIKNHIEQAVADLHSEAGKDAVDYLHSRGLTDETINKYKLGYSASEYFGKAKDDGLNPNRPAIIFPHGRNFRYFSYRCLDAKYFEKPSAERKSWDTDGKIIYAGKQKLYNNYDLTKNDKPVFVTEAVLDALSICQCGGRAVSLVGTAWKEVLMPELKNHPVDYPLILCLDNDPENAEGKRPGQDAQKALAAELEKKNIPYINAHFSLDKYPDGKKDDPNSLLQLDPLQLREDVNRLEEEALRKLKPDNILDYMQTEMPDDIRSLKLDARRKTGFPNLDDKIHALFSGLYFIGGLSSVGKTTWCWQLADQLAEQGEHVIFFSLEMSKLELVSKSISRWTLQLSDSQHAVYGSKYRMGFRNSLVEQAEQKYMHKVGDRISIVQGDFNYDVTKIGKYIDDYIARNKKKPIVFVDYLQILPAALDPETGRKQTDPRIVTNDNVVYLKRISRKYKIPVIVTSALNRSNYLSPIDFESFRESSGIEYSADVVLGLQLNAIHDDVFESEEDKIKKRERLKKARQDRPRVIELACLKNRFGISDFSCYFYYHPEFDFFEVAAYTPPKKKDDDWEQLSAGEQTNLPFTE